MKVKCIDNKNLNGNIVIGITIGKIYDVIGQDKYGYNIINDDNSKLWNYPEEYFRPLSEIRNDKINKLLG
jgi:hypothetical protein